MDDTRNKPGAFNWNELLTTDPAAAVKFYSALFGWTAQEMPMDGFNYTLLKADGKDVGGLMPIPPMSEGMPPHWGAYVTVSDVDATAGNVEALGGKILVPPQDIPTVGRFTVIQDPQGAVISAITYFPRD